MSGPVRDKAEWRRRVHRMKTEAGGLWRVELVRPATLAASSAQPVISLFLEELVEHRQPAPLCLLCDAQLSYPDAIPDAFVLLQPASDGRGVLAAGVCSGCAATSDETLCDKALAQWGSRRIDRANIHDIGGHA